MQHEPLLTWSAYEYPPRKSGSDKYWALGILTLALLTVAGLLENFLFGVLIVLSALLILLYSLKRPLHVTFEIHDAGIVVHQQFYPFRELKAFWILHTETPRLLLQSNHFLSPLVSIPLEGVRTEEIVALLTPHLPEEELHESLAVQLFERMGF